MHIDPVHRIRRHYGPCQQRPLKTMLVLRLWSLGHEKACYSHHAPVQPSISSHKNEEAFRK